MHLFRIFFWQRFFFSLFHRARSIPLCVIECVVLLDNTSVHIVCDRIFICIRYLYVLSRLCAVDVRNILESSWRNEPTQTHYIAYVIPNAAIWAHVKSVCLLFDVLNAIQYWMAGYMARTENIMFLSKINGKRSNTHTQKNVRIKIILKQNGTLNFMVVWNNIFVIDSAQFCLHRRYFFFFIYIYFFHLQVATETLLLIDEQSLYKIA